MLRELVHTYCRETEEEDELTANLNREIGTVKNNRIELEHFYSTACPEEVFRTIYRRMRNGRKRTGSLILTISWSGVMNCSGNTRESCLCGRKNFNIF